jgi:hypothetical protein
VVVGEFLQRALIGSMSLPRSGPPRDLLAVQLVVDRNANRERLVVRLPALVMVARDRG